MGTCYLYKLKNTSFYLWNSNVLHIVSFIIITHIYGQKCLKHKATIKWQKLAYIENILFFTVCQETFLHAEIAICYIYDVILFYGVFITFIHRKVWFWLCNLPLNIKQM